MSRADQVERHIEREEDRLSTLYAAGDISQSEYNDEMRALQREAHDAYEADLEDAQARVRDEWGW